MSDLVPADRRQPLSPHVASAPAAGAGFYPPESEAEGVRPRDLLAVLRRQWWLVLLVTAVVTGIAVYVAQTSAPVYRASAVVRITDTRAAVVGTLGDPNVERTGGGKDPLLSQIYLLKSRGVVGDAVDAAGLRLQSRTEGFSVAQLANVQVASEAPADTLRLRFTTEGVEASNRAGAVRAAYGQLLTIGGARFTVPAAPRTESATLVVVPRDAMIVRVTTGLTAWQRDKTDIIDVAFTDTDPGMAQRVVNGLVEAYRAMSARIAGQQTQRRREFIEEQLATTDAELGQAQRALSEFRSREQVLSLSERFSAQSSALQGLDLERDKLDADLRMFRALLADLRRPRTNRGAQYRNLLSSPGIASNPVISQLYGQLTGYESEREALTSGPWGNSPTHPDVQRLDALISSTEVKLIDAVRSHITASEARLATLNDLRSRNSTAIQRLPGTLVEEMQLVQRVEAVQRRADLLREEYQRVRISEAVEAGQVEIVDLAALPTAAEGTKPKRTILLGLLLGLVLGGGSAFLVETLNTSIRRREEIETVLQVPGLAVIPQIASARPRRGSLLPLLGARAGGHRGRNGNGRVPAQKIAPVLVTLSELHSSQAEAYRTLRTNLIFSQAVQSLRVMAITSALGDEGKTTTASNLAVTFAQQGMRVLLVGADLRRPRIERVFGVAKEPGLTDLLLGQVRVKEAIKPTAVPGLRMLPCGVLPPNPSELLGGQRMRMLLESLSRRFDVIILDTPPLLVAADASVLGAMADGVLLVVRAGRTDRVSAQQARQQLAAVGARVVGAVLNDPDAQVPRYGRYVSYYANYYMTPEEQAEEQSAVSG